MTASDELAEVRERVRARYGQAANAVTGGGVATCGDSCKGDNETGTGSELYDAGEQSEVPDNAVSASLGCGNPIAVAGLQPARRSSTWALAAASTCCYLLAGSARPGRPTAWT